MAFPNANTKVPFALSRARDVAPAELLAMALDILQHEEAHPVDPMDCENAKTKRFRNSVWESWMKFIKPLTPDPDHVWIDLCYRKEPAKAVCRAFLKLHVTTSTHLRPTLGPEEWHTVRTINSAATVQDIWAALVRRADQLVLQPKRHTCSPMEAGLYDLQFSSRNNCSKTGPAYEVGNWIPILARELGLSLTQSFEKRELVDEDIVLLLYTLWSQAAHIHCNPTVRLAFHTTVIISGIGGFRSASVIGMKYEDVEFAWTRDKVNPQKTNLVATITIRHVKQQENKVQRDQRSELKFSITLAPCKQICLLTALAVRAIRDNAFNNNYTSMEQLLPETPPESNYVPLHWKDSMLKKPIIPICYNSYWRVWNRTLYVAGLRVEDEVRPYSLRVGAGGKLDGTLNRAMANYIMSHSTEVFERSYQPRHIPNNLMGIAFDSRAGDTDLIIRGLSSALSRRDQYAPIYVSKEDLDEFEKREDLQTFRQMHQDAMEEKDILTANSLKKRIKYLIDVLEKLKLKERRRQYFEIIDHLRGTHQSTAHLPQQLTKSTRRIKEVPCFQMAVTISGLMREDCSSVKLAAYMVAYQQERNLDAEPRRSKDPKPVRCLLCSLTFTTSATLSRHVSNTHLFDQEFTCPECHRNGNSVVIGPSCIYWASHVKHYHKQFIAPSVSKCMQPAYCPLCTKRFTESGFSRHACMKNKNKLLYPFACPECKREGINDAAINSFDDWALHVQEIHYGGDAVLGAIMRQREVKRPASMLDCGDFGRELKKVKDDDAEGTSRIQVQ